MNNAHAAKLREIEELMASYHDRTNSDVPPDREKGYRQGATRTYASDALDVVRRFLPIGYRQCLKLSPLVEIVWPKLSTEIRISMLRQAVADIYIPF